MFTEEAPTGEEFVPSPHTVSTRDVEIYEDVEDLEETDLEENESEDAEFEESDDAEESEESTEDEGYEAEEADESEEPEEVEDEESDDDEVKQTRGSKRIQSLLKEKQELEAKLEQTSQEAAQKYAEEREQVKSQMAQMAQQLQQYQGFFAQLQQREQAVQERQAREAEEQRRAQEEASLPAHERFEKAVLRKAETLVQEKLDAAFNSKNEQFQQSYSKFQKQREEKERSERLERMNAGAIAKVSEAYGHLEGEQKDFLVDQYIYFSAKQRQDPAKSETMQEFKKFLSEVYKTKAEKPVSTRKLKKKALPDNSVGERKAALEPSGQAKEAGPDITNNQEAIDAGYESYRDYLLTSNGYTR